MFLYLDNINYKYKYININKTTNQEIYPYLHQIIN